MNESGFYKLEIENNQHILLYGPNCVINSQYELLKEFHDTYEYPVDGWMWFDSENEAKIYFNIQENQE